MNTSYDPGIAKDEELPVFSFDMLRTIAAEREREIQVELRRRWLISKPDKPIRWHQRPSRRRPEAR